MTILSEQLEQLLIDLEEYFDDRADADHDGENFVSNQAAKFLYEIREIQSKLLTP